MCFCKFKLLLETLLVRHLVPEFIKASKQLLRFFQQEAKILDMHIPSRTVYTKKAVVNQIEKLCWVRLEMFMITYKDVSKKGTYD